MIRRRVMRIRDVVMLKNATTTTRHPRRTDVLKVQN
jgi:hypothetical protein